MNSLFRPSAQENRKGGRVLLFADGGVAFDNAFVELVVAFLSRAAGFGFALLKTPLNLSLTFFTRVYLLCGVRCASGIRCGEQEREQTENYCEG